MNIIQIFASAGWGGGEKYAYDLARTLSLDGHNVFIVSRPSEIISSKAKEGGLPHLTLPLKGAADLFSAFGLARLLRRHRTDIIHVHNFKDAFTAVYANILCGRSSRIIITRHLVRKGKRSFLHKWLYRKVDKIIFVSELARNEFLSTIPAHEAPETQVIYNSIPVPRQSEEPARIPDNLREKFGIDDDTFLVGFTGRIAPEKGADILIRSIGEIKEARVAAVFIGSGEDGYIKRLGMLADSCGAAGKVFFYGYADDVYGLVNQMDAGAIPSVVPEAFCLSAIEYMYAAKPVVATDNGAQREYIRPGQNGLLVKAGDSSALAAAIETLARRPALGKELGREGRRTFFDMFGYETFYKCVTEAYLSIMPHA